MKTSCRIEVPIQLLVRSDFNEQLNDERFFRDLAVEMVRGMPMEELHKLIRLTKIDPYSEESENKFFDHMQPDCVKEHLILLKKKNIVLYEAVCDLP